MSDDLMKLSMEERRIECVGEYREAWWVAPAIAAFIAVAVGVPMMFWVFRPVVTP